MPKDYGHDDGIPSQTADLGYAPFSADDWKTFTELITPANLAVALNILAHRGYIPDDGDGWQDADPATVIEALNRIASGHAGVIIVTPTEPTDAADGQGWFDTADSPTEGLGIRVPRTETSDYTLVLTDDVLWCDTTSGPITVTMPDVTDRAFKMFSVKKISTDGNAVTIISVDGDTFDGDANVVIPTPQNSVNLTSDNVSDWKLS